MRSKRGHNCTFFPIVNKAYCNMDEIKGIRIVSLTGEKEYGIEDSEVREELANVVDGAPEELNSFKEAFEKFKEGSEALAGIAAEVAAVGKAVADETERAQSAEQVLDGKIGEEVRRATIAEQGIEAKALDASSAEYEATENTVVLKFATIEGTGDEAVIPAATTEKAGIMSAKDKKALDNVPNTIKDAISEEAKATDEKIAKEKVRAEQAEQALANDIANAPNLALRALYVAAGAEYNDSGADKTKTAPWGETVTHKAGHYYLNGLGDITEEQMLDIYNAGKFWISDDCSGFATERIRTNLPPLQWTSYYYKTYRMVFLFNNITAEVAVLGKPERPISVSDIRYTTQSAIKLKRVVGVIDISKAVSNNAIYINGEALEFISLKGAKTNVALKCPVIDQSSVLYCIQNATPTSAITITLNAAAYARLADDAEIIAALEAQPLITLAST